MSTMDIPELRHLILSNLSCVDVITFSKVNKYHQTVLQDEELWRELQVKEFALFPNGYCYPVQLCSMACNDLDTISKMVMSRFQTNDRNQYHKIYDCCKKLLGDGYSRILTANNFNNHIVALICCVQDKNFAELTLNQRDDISLYDLRTLKLSQLFSDILVEIGLERPPLSDGSRLPRIRQ